MSILRPILLVEDNPNDVESTLAALADARRANAPPAAPGVVVPPPSTGPFGL